MSLMHITNFTYAKYDHAQIYATTASCFGKFSLPLQAIGSFTIDDGYGSKNVTFKRN